MTTDPIIQSQYSISRSELSRRFQEISARLHPLGEEWVYLYKAVNGIEHYHIRNLGSKGFPAPRDNIMGDFIPTIHEAYAEKLAREWKCKENGNVGMVLRFKVKRHFLKRYDQHVSSWGYVEYHIPVKEMLEMNRNIVGEIEAVRCYTAQSK